MIAFSSGAIRSSRQFSRVCGDRLVELGDVLERALGDRLRERLRVSEQILERAPGDLLLIDREGGIAALF